MSLQCESISKYFGNFAALKNLSFHVSEGIIFGIAGPNGAGKTTLFNVISGHHSPNSGKIKFLGRDIHGMKPHQICRLGIARTFQIPTCFRSLTALKNVLVGATFGNPEHKNPKEEVMDALEFTQLLDKKDVVAENLSLFERKRLMMAVALATKPKLLMLDEPIGGLNPAEIEQSMDLITKTNDLGITLILVEHVMKAIMNLSNRIMILHHGEKLAEGAPVEVARDERVIETYLGETYI